MAERIAEKEAAEAAAAEKKRLEKEAARVANTPEGRLAEKLRQQKLEENSNLELAKDMMGKTNDSR